MLVTRLEWDEVWRFSSDARVWITASHVLAAFVWTAVTGALWSIHMRYWWRKNENRVLGGVLVSLSVILTLSAIFILYSGSEELSTNMSVVHTGLGLLVFVPYFLHIRRARR
jgi:heme A synthase